MGIDMDSLDDLFADEGVQKARAVGKFQPKARAKFRPTRKDFAASSVSSSQPVQSIDSPEAELSEPVRTNKSSENCLDVVSNENEGRHAPVEKSVSENADIFIGLEALGDILPNTTTDIGGAPPSDEVAFSASNPENVDPHVPPIPTAIEDATGTFKDDVSMCPELSADLDPLTSGVSEVSIVDGCSMMHGEQLDREEIDMMDSLNVSDLTTKPEPRRGKFQPKPKIHMHKEMCGADEPISYAPGSQRIQPEISYSETNSVPAFQQDDMLDLSDLGFTQSLPTEVTSELPVNPLREESVCHTETNQLDSGVLLDGVPEIPAKLASRRGNSRSKTHPASVPSPQHQQASMSGDGNETGRILRPRKSKRILRELVDEAEEEVLASGDISDPISSSPEEENVIIEEFEVENESQMEKVKRKSKKPDDGSEKPARKRKKSEKAPDKGAKAKPTKFPHSTRRRRVDKVLLETPEDEIDYQKVPLRDLILLAEHKERLLKKDEAAAATTAKKQSNGYSSSHRNEDGIFNSQDDGDYNDGQASPTMEDTTVYFNYQTHMDKTPATRWSKQETELFYEVVRQFGTDLSMIQQLFPGRTRHQVKLKYKKEERKHPLRLREALERRPNDHSHFEKLIQYLKKKSAEEGQNADAGNDDPVELTGHEADEGTCNVDKEETNGDHIQEKEKGEKEDAVKDFKVQSPSKTDDNDNDFDNEDDLFIWSQYKSDT